MDFNTKERVSGYVDKWENRCYKDGIPDEAPAELKDKIPNYKSIALCLLNNDLQLKGIGFKAFESKYYSMLKRIEIDARQYKGKQLKLKL